MCTAVYHMYMYCTICCIESSDIMTGTVHVQDSGSCGIWNLSAIGVASGCGQCMCLCVGVGYEVALFKSMASISIGRGFDSISVNFSYD